MISACHNNNPESPANRAGDGPDNTHTRPTTSGNADRKAHPAGRDKVRRRSAYLDRAEKESIRYDPGHCRIHRVSSGRTEGVAEIPAHSKNRMRVFLPLGLHDGYGQRVHQYDSGVRHHRRSAADGRRSGQDGRYRQVPIFLPQSKKVLCMRRSGRDTPR